VAAVAPRLAITIDDTTVDEEAGTAYRPSSDVAAAAS
jgi:hypothetical protein